MQQSAAFDTRQTSSQTDKRHNYEFTSAGEQEPYNARAPWRRAAAGAPVRASMPCCSWPARAVSAGEAPAVVNGGAAAHVM